MSLTYKLNRICPICGTKISDKNKSGFCNRHRDRTGKNNPFFGKHHSKEACETAGNVFVNNLNTYQYNWVSKGLLSNKKEISVETNNQSNIGKSYQCIEVK